MKRESMILLAFASLLILLPACKRKDGCGIFTCGGKETKKIEKKKVVPMQEGMKKKVPAAKTPAKTPAKAKKVIKK